MRKTSHLKGPATGINALLRHISRRTCMPHLKRFNFTGHIAMGAIKIYASYISIEGKREEATTDPMAA